MFRNGLILLALLLFSTVASSEITVTNGKSTPVKVTRIDQNYFINALSAKTHMGAFKAIVSGNSVDLAAGSKYKYSFKDTGAHVLVVIPVNTLNESSCTTFLNWLCTCCTAQPTGINACIVAGDDVSLTAGNAGVLTPTRGAENVECKHFSFQLNSTPSSPVMSPSFERRTSFGIENK